MPVRKKQRIVKYESATLWAVLSWQIETKENIKHIFKYAVMLATVYLILHGWSSEYSLIGLATVFLKNFDVKVHAFTFFL